MAEQQYGQAPAQQAPDGQPQVMAREKPEVDPATKALIDKWERRVTEAKTHWGKRFKKMRTWQKFVRGKQWEGQTEDDDRYVCNITGRQIKGRVDAIYAKNPTVVAKRRPRMDFEIWDGNPQSLQALQAYKQAMAQGTQMAQMGMPAPPPSPEMEELAADIAQGMQTRRMLDRLARTLELVCKHQLDEPVPNFKGQMKQCVRRVKTNGVAYVKLGYQRMMGRTPEWHAKFKDHSDELARIERLAADVADGKIMPEQAEIEELRRMVQALQAQQEVVLREGLIFDFPRSTQIIVDTACTQLKGFVNAHWLAHEMTFSPDKIKEIYKIDLGKEFKGHKPEAGPDKDKEMAVVWEIYDLDSQLTLTICEGYCGYLKAPAKPDIYFEQFHPVFALTLNDLEDEDDIFPESDVETIKHMQMEYNRSGESRRKHRQAARPGYVTANGVFGKTDKTKLATHEDHEVIELDAMLGNDNSKISDKLQPKPVAQVDPVLFETEALYADILRSSGDQEANLGGTSGATATESTIAENSRASGLQSDTDELDEFLSLIARAAGHILLSNMGEETVKRIAGKGAVWTTLSRKDMAEEVYLVTQAGSSGRPNRALKLSNMERALPFLVQIPGVNPVWLGKKVVRAMDDDDIDIDEAMVEGMPSITAINGMAQPSTGEPGSDPNAQGGEGGGNQQRPQGSTPPPKAGFPSNPGPSAPQQGQPAG